MTQILKRLEIIKSSIAIEDEEVIELQVMKLQKLDIDDDVKAIVTHLEAMNYAKAMKDIEVYLTRYSGVVKYVDSETQGLKLELKCLESKLQELIEQKSEYLNDIEEFNREYNLHLGELIKEILELKKEILYKQTIKKQKQKVKYQEDIQTHNETKETIDELKSTITELEDALESIDEDDENYEELTQAYHELKEELEKLEDELELQEKELEKAKEFIEDESIEQEYEEVKSHYEEFESEYEHIKESVQNSPTLNDEEKKELKSLYKKAARLCHPDIVPDELKEKAHELMQKLNDAYSKKDISKVKEILHSLQNGTSFEVSSETIEDKELLKQKIKEYKQNIEDLKSELEEIKSDDTYQTIVELDDWDEYFKELKNELEVEKERLKDEASTNISWDIDTLNKNVFIAWAENHDIKIENTSVLTATNKQLEEVPSEIVLFKNFKNIYLNKNKLKELPEYIVGLTDLKRLNLSDNYKLLLTSKQKEWIATLQKNGCNITIDDDLLTRTKQSIKDKYNLYKNDMPWLNNILRWAFENYLDTIISQKETLQYTEVLKLNGYSLEFIPKDIAKLKNLKELKLWNNHLEELPEEISTMSSLEKLTLSNNNLIKLPNNIIQLKLKKLQLLDNKSLILTNEQKKWIKELQANGCDLEIDKDLLSRKEKLIEENETKTKKSLKRTGLFVVKKKNKTTNPITKETSPYAKHIQEIENIKFEKIRKYCENLLKENQADEMQKQLAEKGRMNKALIYSTLEVFIEKLSSETITLCDWGSSQGIASMLVLDYIKEKQLDIKVSDVILIDDDTKALSRAMAQVEALAQDSIKFTALKSDDNGICDTIKSNKNNIVLNLFANDKIPTSFWTIDYEIFEDSYFLCVSNENKEFVDEIYENINSFMDIQDLSILDGKIGRFEKFERIFEAADNEIPF